jgi:hypothetical protein
MTGRFKPYLRTLTLVFVVLTASVVALNYFVDPYDVFGRNRLGIYVAADRQSKPAMIGRFPHDAVLMGTSKAAMVDTTQLEGWRFFSATFGGARVEELYYFAENHLHAAKLVVIALDYGMFADTFPIIAEDPFRNRGVSFYFPYLVELGMARDSIQTISRHLRKRTESFRPDGSFIADKWTAAKSVPNPALLEQLFALERASYEKMNFSEERMRYLEKLRDVLDSRGIPAVVVINPLHERSVKLLRASQQAPLVEAWQQRVRALFPETVDLMDSRYSAAGNFFAADPVHFKPATGVEFLNREVLAPRKRNLNASRPPPNALPARLRNAAQTDRRPRSEPRTTHG